jgi:hypothetical protein
MRPKSSLPEFNSTVQGINIMKDFRRRFYAAIAASLVTGSALAAPPPNLAGTTWDLLSNRATEQLVIITQGGAGAPGAATCRTIDGTLGIAPVRGWYCPATGRIHFKHNNVATGTTVRVYVGNVSDQIVGQPLFMGGTVMVDDAAFGDLGEFNFAARN